MPNIQPCLRMTGKPKAQTLCLYHKIRRITISAPMDSLGISGCYTYFMTTPKVASFILQDRDLALFRGLFESRVMTAEHIAALYFDGKSEATKKRLQKLKAAGFLNERPRKAFDPAVHFLTRKSFNLLNERGVLRDYPPFSLAALEKRARVSQLTLRHELEVMDVKIAFHSGTKQSNPFKLVEFSTWPLLSQFEAFRHSQPGAEVTVKPDGFIRIHETETDGGVSEHAFFLEVDRSTETLDTLIARASCYVDYYKSGGFAERNGGKREEYREYPFRVLMIFKTAERRNNIAERLLQHTVPINSQVMLTTQAEATTNPLGAIWVLPIDYRKATENTPFDVSNQRETWGYKRQTEREMFVEAKVEKRRLLDA